MTQILIVGATSAMARGCAYAWAKQGQRLVLAGRDLTELERIASDIRLRFASNVQVAELDLDNAKHLSTRWSDIEAAHGDIDGVLMAAGWMPEDSDAMRRDTPALQVIARNFTGPVALLNAAADAFEARKNGFIVGISSVAGDRGRQSNYLYGAAKGGFSIYLAGLRNRLFVDTRMTWGLPGLFLVADPMQLGEQIVQAQAAGKSTVYLPSFWRLIMLIIQHVPEFVFKRLKL